MVVDYQNGMTRQGETAAVKRALIAAGFDKNNIRVSHGNGTAWGWLKIFADIRRANDCTCGQPDQYGRREICDACRLKWREINNRMTEVTKQTTGRHGDHDGRISLQLDWTA